MTHPLVDQLRFTRREWRRGLEGVSAGDALRRFGRLNPIGWVVGHLAWQEQRYWLTRAQGQTPYPRLNDLYASGAPTSAPALAESLELWQQVTLAADPYLDRLTTAGLEARWPLSHGAGSQSVGSALLRMIYHYWFHLGEILAIRQMLDQTGLPEYVGDLEDQAPYRSHV